MILDILNQIAATDSTNAKQKILMDNAENNLLKEVYRLTYHPQIQYGIKKIPEYTESNGPKMHLDHGLNFLETMLAKRYVTGNEAIAEFAETLSTLTADDAEVIKRIIKRDLECGASSTIANKVWKNIVPKQPQMLAQPMSEKALANIKFPAYAQLKADGSRCFAEIRGDDLDDVKLLSRAGNEYQGLDDIKQNLIDATKAYREVHGSVMIDGELVCFGHTNDTDGLTVIKRSETNGIATKSLRGTIGQMEARQMRFQVWDLVPLDVVYDNEKSIFYDKRFEHLSELFQDNDLIIIIENTVVHDLEEARKIYMKYVDMGLEGIILKNIKSLWVNKRSKDLVKFKEEIFVDLRIVGVQVHSKDNTKLGAILCESDDGLIKVKCGSGFTDTNQVKTKAGWVDIPYDELDELNRTKLWNTDLIGKLVEIKCNGGIMSEGRTDSISLFLPIMVRFRIDKNETNTLEDTFPDLFEKLEKLQND